MQEEDVEIIQSGSVFKAGELLTDPMRDIVLEHCPKARLIPLQVAGAFHTEHMRPAVDVLARYARAMTTRDPRTRLLSNARALT